MTKLEAKIKAILEGKESLADENVASNEASKQAAEQAAKQNRQVTKGKPEVSESSIPDEEDEFKGDFESGESGKEKTSKIRAKESNRDANPSTIKQPVKADPEDDNGDNERGKLSPSAALKTSEKGEKLKAESMDALFSGEELTEEFKMKAEAIFEAVVEQIVEDRVEALQEEYQLQLTEAVEEVKGELVEQIDGYLDYVVEQWIQDNAIALESGMKVEMVDSFINGIKNVFTEHYVSVPEDKVDVVQEQAKQIEELESQLASLQEEAEKAEIEAKILRCENILKSISEGMTAVQYEKFKELAENFNVEDEAEFELKAKTLKESMFKDSKNTSQELTEDIDNSSSDPMVKAVAEALRKGNKMKFVRN